MRKFYLLTVVLGFMASSAFAQVDYTPTNTGTRPYEQWGDKREISKVVLTHADGSVDELALDATQKTQEYVDATALKTFVVAPEEEVTISIVFANTNTSWVHHYVYIDTDAVGFTADINSNGYTPEGDLVAYSFYNNGIDNDNSGYDSNGKAIVDNDRSMPAIPSFAVTDADGVYRMRIKQDWCNIDPMGDSDGKFPNAAVPNLTDFQANGGQIIDVMIQVGDGITPEPGPGPDPDPGIDVVTGYTPRNTGTRTFVGEEENEKRNISKIQIIRADNTADEFVLSEAQKAMDFVDATNEKTFYVEPGETITVVIERENENSAYINHYVYIDADFDGNFTADINRNGYRPEGDMVAYSFYNNGSDSDESGVNSAGDEVSGDSRKFPSIPSFTVTEDKGFYRMRVKQDWCSIDPAGDADANFGGTFKDYGGQIIDFVLQVGKVTEPNPELSVESVVLQNENVVCYDLTGRRVKEIVKPGIYIINGKKTVVK